jgi:hypothetical protein
MSEKAVEEAMRRDIEQTPAPEREPFVDDGQILLDFLESLSGDTCVRIYRGRGGIYVFRDDPSPKGYSVKVFYFFEGNWHETVEGVDFDDVKPWRPI